MKKERGPGRAPHAAEPGCGSILRSDPYLRYISRGTDVNLTYYELCDVDRLCRNINMRVFKGGNRF